MGIDYALKKSSERTMALEPLHQFEVTTLIPIKIAGVDLSITNSSAFMMAAVGLIMVFFTLAFSTMRMVPGRLQSFGEVCFDLVDGIRAETIGGQKHRAFLPFIVSIFLFIFMGNALGLLPLAFTFTSQCIVNVAMGCLILAVVMVYGLKSHGLSFLRLFAPKGLPGWIFPLLTPIEVISFLSRPISLGVRLFANMVAGHTILKIFGYFTVQMKVLGVFPLIVNMAIMGFEFFVAFLQAYVFTTLSCVYLNDAFDVH